MVMSEEYNELAHRCNEIMGFLKSLPQDRADAWVDDVIGWFADTVKQMQNEVIEAQGNKIMMLKKLREIQQKYQPIIQEKKPELIVALTYAIKPQFQEKLAPLLYAMLGLI